MNRWNIAVMMLFVFTSCALFKRTEKTAGQSHLSQSNLNQLSNTEESTRLTNASTMRYLKDSSQLAYSIQLWPKGKFTFLPDGGFSGEFDSVKLQGNRTGKSLLTDSSRTGFFENRHSRSKSISKSNSTADQKNTFMKSLPDIKIIILFSIALSALLIFSVITYRRHKAR